jgi:hypothetical protein
MNDASQREHDRIKTVARLLHRGFSSMVACFTASRAPRFLPPWISDPRHLLAMLTFTVFANLLDIEPLVAVVTKLLDSAPVVRMPSAG